MPDDREVARILARVVCQGIVRLPYPIDFHTLRFAEEATEVWFSLS